MPDDHAPVKPSESKLWRPSQWSPDTVERFGLHVQKYALKQVDSATGASIKSKMDEIRTVAALKARGVKRIGDA